MSNPTDSQIQQRKISMHEGVELWCDVCCCEPEPRWQRLAEEMEEEARARSGPALPHAGDRPDSAPASSSG